MGSMAEYSKRLQRLEVWVWLLSNNYPVGQSAGKADYHSGKVVPYALEDSNHLLEGLSMYPRLIGLIGVTIHLRTIA
jgi:hypothetical protein